MAQEYLRYIQEDSPANTPGAYDLFAGAVRKIHAYAEQTPGLVVTEFSSSCPSITAETPKEDGALGFRGFNLHCRGQACDEHGYPPTLYNPLGELASVGYTRSTSGDAVGEYHLSSEMLQIPEEDPELGGGLRLETSLKLSFSYQRTRHAIEEVGDDRVAIRLIETKKDLARVLRTWQRVFSGEGDILRHYRVLARPLPAPRII